MRRVNHLPGRSGWGGGVSFRAPRRRCRLERGSPRGGSRGRPARTEYRAAVIGHTGQGNCGHGLDTVWRDLPETQLVAVADADPAGLGAAVKRLGDVKGFADYRKMLDEVRPDLVAVAPRWLDQHREMVVAAAESGARNLS